MTLDFNDIFSPDSMQELSNTSIEGGGDTAIGALSVAGTAGLTAIGLPFLAPILTGLLGNMTDSVNAILKYGLSAWGASWTPESAKAKWGQTVLPYLKIRLDSLTEGDFSTNLDQLYQEFQGNYITYKKLSNTFDARSSREAMAWAAAETKKLQDEIFKDGIFPALKENGGIVRLVSFSGNPKDTNGLNWLWQEPMGTDGNYTLYRLELDLSNVSSGSSTTATIDEKGDVNVKSSGGGMLMLGGLALAVYKLKIFS